MCEAQSPPLPGDDVFISWTVGRPVPQLGEEFTEPWGNYNVTYRVDELRGPGKLTGRERIVCTVMKVDYEENHDG